MGKKGFDRFMNPNGGRKRSAPQPHKKKNKFWDNKITNSIEEEFQMRAVMEQTIHELMLFYGFDYSEALEIYNNMNSEEE